MTDLKELKFQYEKITDLLDQYKEMKTGRGQPNEFIQDQQDEMEEMLERMYIELGQLLPSYKELP